MANTIDRGMDFSPFWFINFQISWLCWTRRSDEVALVVRKKISVTRQILVGGLSSGIHDCVGFVVVVFMIMRCCCYCFIFSFAANS